MFRKLFPDGRSRNGASAVGVAETPRFACEGVISGGDGEKQS